MKKKFATAINCIDGRAQLPIIEWIKKEALVDFVDMITEPGVNKILSDNIDNKIIDSIKEKVLISIEKHKSKFLAIAGHFDCAKNLCVKDLQLKQIKNAIDNVISWDFNIKVVGLWVDENFSVHKI